VLAVKCSIFCVEVVAIFKYTNIFVYYTLYNKSMKVAVIGGGAAGYFSAIHVKENYPDSEVEILEKTKKTLSKVKISGGGRCNVTNASTSIAELSQAYPRGGKFLKKLFSTFNTVHTMAWFKERGVELYAQDDQRVFPVSNDSQTIVDCLSSEVNRLGIKVNLGINVTEIIPTEEGIELSFNKDRVIYDKVIIASGGSPKTEGLNWLKKLGHKIEPSVPSLFSFNMPNEIIKELMGVSVQHVRARIQGEKLSSEGPLLITHWGMSGPAVLVLSAFGARILAEKKYHFNVHINWSAQTDQESVRTMLNEIVKNNANKKLQSIKPYHLPSRLWEFLLKKSSLERSLRWKEIGKKGINRLVEVLSNDVYEVNGKTTFKEEFVTCGGVSLKSIHTKTLESKVVPNLFFAGEVLDIDAITGGYNFQAAWTTGFIAGKLGA